MNHSINKKARENRNNMSPPEKKFWYEVLSCKQTGYKFLRQHPIDHYIPDFYCRELKLVIEIDGDSHVFQQHYDQMRTQKLKQKGLKVLRFNNRDVLYNLDNV